MVAQTRHEQDKNEGDGQAGRSGMNGDRVNGRVTAKENSNVQLPLYPFLMIEI
jgi:hypothetical protein